jgi:hypothetical protein
MSHGRGIHLRFGVLEFFRPCSEHANNRGCSWEAKLEFGLRARLSSLCCGFTSNRYFARGQSLTSRRPGLFGISCEISETRTKVRIRELAENDVDCWPAVF